MGEAVSHAVSHANGERTESLSGLAREPIEVVVVCLDCSDYLRHTLPLLAKVADWTVVVTAERDTQTIEVVSQFENCCCVCTDVFWKDGARFNKGAAINEGFRRLSRSGWILHTDADMALFNPVPTDGLDKALIWTAHRYRVIGAKGWKCLNLGARAFPRIERDFVYRGKRTAIGYFQLFHSSAFRWYPDNHPGANVSDLFFSHSFPDMGLLEDYQTFHIEASGDTKGVNWNGRVSQPFVV
jgi:hypothetical protein